ncbi:MAG: DNA polymerase III subunit delta [Tenuifilaceae bacterium]|jgi:DNA polymerase-3 subunit delta'|nr:DNA polymerase III subunit delta [Bacteroidales bacterium]MDI9517227.1 DNA polymerase III subunit delta [Bacteroidota bacterium]NLH56711.1 DNA polymerase III subunit delta [Rikenellaceae bacterium]OQC63029.1 MAG: DNA polymerase III subunit tau [Bacteroidetes bacterium ADurb.Bin008]HNV82127.1 DNA polymerase III subunit delta [Tenuifilaceae bacterium]
MLFKDIVGQSEVKNKLIRSVRDNRIAHAQLFTGPEGTGKLMLAIAYAQYISCQNRGENDSCGVCSSCHKFEKLIHPDLHFVFPVNETKKKDEDEKSASRQSDAFIRQWREAILFNPYISESQWYETIGLENKLGIINTAESSEVIKKLSLKSFEADYKTMIIWLPERMHINASNRLLKLIEEPPPKTLFLLITENMGALLSTILSRTQIVKILPLKREEIATALVERYRLSPGKAQDISRVANGNFQTALTLTTITEENPYFEMFRQLMRHCYSKNVLGLLDWVDEASSLSREKQKEMMLYSIKTIRECFMLNIGLGDIAYLSGEEADFGKKFSPFVNNSNIKAIYAHYNSAIEHLGRNGNPQVVFTDFSLNMALLINRKT